MDGELSSDQKKISEFKDGVLNMIYSACQAHNIENCQSCGGPYIENYQYQTRPRCECHQCTYLRATDFEKMLLKIDSVIIKKEIDDEFPEEMK